MTVPSKFLIDKRAADVVANADGEPDDVLSTKEVAHWLRLSTQWLEIGRCRGYGPRFVRLSPRRVRYRRADILTWLDERTHAATGEYDTGGTGRSAKTREAADA